MFLEFPVIDYANTRNQSFNKLFSKGDRVRNIAQEAKSPAIYSSPGATFVRESPHNIKSAMTFYDDWFNQIIVKPDSIDLAFISSKQIIKIEVFNSYDVEKTLNDIFSTGSSNIKISNEQTGSLVLPKNYRGRQSIIYDFEVDVTGSPIIDDTYTFDFVAAIAGQVKITGSRITSFPYPANWASRVTESYTWKTSLLTSRNGREQRQAIFSKPRRILDYSVTVLRNTSNLDALLWDGQARAYAIPYSIDAARLLQNMDEGTNFAAIKTASKSYETNGLAIIIKNSIIYEVLEIKTVTSGGIEFKRNATISWLAGSLIYPVAVCRVASNQAAHYITSNYLRADLSFEYVQTPSIAPAEPIDSHLGQPAYLKKPDWSGGADHLFIRTYERLDYGGYIGIDDQIGHPATTKRLKYKFFNKQSHLDFIAWLHARRGRLKPFWMPTWTNDLVLTKKYSTATDH